MTNEYGDLLSRPLHEWFPDGQCAGSLDAKCVSKIEGHISHSSGSLAPSGLFTRADIDSILMPPPPPPPPREANIRGRNEFVLRFHAGKIKQN